MQRHGRESRNAKLPEDVRGRIRLVQQGGPGLNLGRMSRGLLHGLDVGAIRAFAGELRGIPQVTELDLWNCNIDAERAAIIFPALRDLPKLVHLRLMRNALGRRGGELLAAVVGHLSLLEQLGLSGNNLTGPGVAAVVRALKTCPRLAILSVNDNGVGAAGAAEVALALRNVPALEDLSIGDNDLGPDGERAIVMAACSTTTTLKSIDRIGDDCILLNRHLAALDLDPVVFHAADNATILTFLRDRNAQGAVPAARVRVMLVGHGGAGKTALARRIVRGTFEAGTPATEGVELHEVELPIPNHVEHKEGGGADAEPHQQHSHLTVQLVDTAGQPVYSGSHALFEDATSIFVVVVDPTAVDHDQGAALLPSFVASVHAQADSARVVVVATHAHGHTPEHAAAMDAAMASLLHSNANVDPAWLAVDSQDGRGVDALVARVRDAVLDAGATRNAAEQGSS